LKQCPRAWNQKLDVFLKNIEFVRSDADFSVYIAQVGDVKFFIVVYVDDLILVCNNKDKFLQVKEELSRKFEMKDLGDLGYIKEKKAMVIRCDNQGAISLKNNPMQHAQTKHIDVQHHFVRERVENGEVTFEYCSIENMVADVLTKALPKE
jgi:hypothetical protein